MSKFKLIGIRKTHDYCITTRPTIILKFDVLGDGTKEFEVVLDMRYRANGLAKLTLHSPNSFRCLIGSEGRFFVTGDYEAEEEICKQLIKNIEDVDSRYKKLFTLLHRYTDGWCECTDIFDPLTNEWEELEADDVALIVEKLESTIEELRSDLGR